jgi:hypothetical protein
LVPRSGFRISGVPSLRWSTVGHGIHKRPGRVMNNQPGPPPQPQDQSQGRRDTPTRAEHLRRDAEELAWLQALTPEQRAEAIEATRTRFTWDDLREIKRRRRESQKMTARLAATETLEEQQQRAKEIVPRFDRWVRGRNRIRRTRAMRTTIVRTSTMPRTRAREHCPQRHRRRATSRTASGEDPPGEGEPALAPIAERRLG